MRQEEVTCTDILERARRSTTMKRPYVKHFDHSTVDASCGIPVLELDTQGCIRACTSSAAHLFGYEDEAVLLGRSISQLLPQFEQAPLMHQGKVSGRLKLLSRCGVPFRARRRNGEHFDADLCINEFDDPLEMRVVMTVQARAT